MNIPKMTDADLLDLAHKSDGFWNTYGRVIEAARDAQWQAALAEQEPVARIVPSGPHDFPLLEWLSADHSFRAPIGSMLYAAPPAHADRTVCAYPDCHCPTETPCLQGLPFSAPTNPAAQERAEPVAPAVQEAMRTAPEQGSDYWRLTPTGGWMYTWTGSQEDHAYMRNGLAFATREALQFAQYGGA